MARIEWYLREVVPLFILGTAFLFFFDKLNLLVIIQNFAAPLVQGFLGLPARATEAFLIGFLRRDYGAAGLFDLTRNHLLNHVQIVVSLVTITLFVPCIANVFMMIKERGMKTAMWMVAFIFPFAFFVGGVLNWVLKWMSITF
jgi:ferrous iron transport protein B